MKIAEIQGIKLVTGEELIAKVSLITAEHIVVKDALLISMDDDPTGLTCNFYPWTIVPEGQVFINRNTVVAYYTATKEMQEMYLHIAADLQVTAATPVQLLNE